MSAIVDDALTQVRATVEAAWTPLAGARGTDPREDITERITEIAVTTESRFTYSLAVVDDLLALYTTVHERALAASVEHKHAPIASYTVYVSNPEVVPKKLTRTPGNDTGVITVNTNLQGWIQDWSMADIPFTVTIEVNTAQQPHLITRLNVEEA